MTMLPCIVMEHDSFSGQEVQWKELPVIPVQEIPVQDIILGATPPPPKGRPRGGSVTKNSKNLPAPPCLGEALRRVSS